MYPEILFSGLPFNDLGLSGRVILDAYACDASGWVEVIVDANEFFSDHRNIYIAKNGYKYGEQQKKVFFKKFQYHINMKYNLKSIKSQN